LTEAVVSREVTGAATPLTMVEHEAARLAAVASYEILDTPRDGAFDRITALAARLLQAPIAIVSIVDEDRIWFKSHHGIDAQQVGRDPGLCASAILQDDVWVIENAAVDPRALANPLVAGDLGLRFYAGAPLRTHEGYSLGTLCVLDRAPRRLSPDEARTLEDLAAIVVHELDLRLEARRAVRGLGEREELEARMRRDAESMAAEARSRAAELEAVLEAVPDAFYLIDGQGRVALANRAGTQLLSSRHSLGDVLSKFTDERGDSPSLADIQMPGSLQLRRRLSDRSFEARAYRTSTGESASLEPKGAGPASILILRDVTDEHRQRALQEALVGMLSHELRTPVTSIYAAAQLLAKDGAVRTADDQRALIHDVASEAERLRRLIEDLVVLTRAEGGEVKIGSEPVHLRHVLEHVVKAGPERWPDHRFELAIGPSMPAIAGDETYVEQVIDNLVSNAAKYSDRGTLIQIVVTQVDDSVDVHVRDEGPGIQADDREHLFEMLFRSSATAGKAPGAGIGLFVCRTLARAMGGDVRLDPSASGSDFVVRLPIYSDR